MQTSARLPAIDMLRGFVIALMALDHARDFFAPAAFQPEDLAATTPGWFWTRWITHLCATAFVLLAGSSAYLRGMDRGVPALSRYLLTRGLMLLVLEATWISFSWQFGFNIFIMQVLWALGMGMVFLALLVWLPRPAVAAIATLLIVTHNLLDDWKPGGLLWMAWHQGGFYPLGGQGHGIAFMYPLMPWLGLIAGGYTLGPVFGWEPGRRRRFLLGAAAVLFAAFVGLRAGNYYGDPLHWMEQGRGFMYDLMSFVRVQKYPPSLLYLCITVSISLCLLVLFERMRPLPLLMLFGRAPLFFYVVHIAPTHFLGGLYMYLRHGGAPEWSENGLRFPDGYQASLAAAYLGWLAMLAIMAGLTWQWSRWRAVRRI